MEHQLDRTRMVHQLQ